MGIVPLTPYLTPEDRESRAGPIGILNATIPYWWDEDYRQRHLRLSDFKHGWSKEAQEKVLARWNTDYGLDLP